MTISFEKQQQKRSRPKGYFGKSGKIVIPAKFTHDRLGKIVRVGDRVTWETTDFDVKIIKQGGELLLTFSGEENDNILVLLKAKSVIKKMTCPSAGLERKGGDNVLQAD